MPLMQHVEIMDAARGGQAMALVWLTQRQEELQMHRQTLLRGGRDATKKTVMEDEEARVQ